MGDLCFQDGEKVLFVGDSITDCGRRGPAAPLGDGYVSLLHDLVIWRRPERRLAWVNKGIGGNKVTDLQSRWEDDVIREAPDWLSVKIGINDLHTHLMGAPGAVSPARFRQVYEEILSRAAAETNANLMLITPFYVSNDTSGHSFRSQVLELLPEHISTVEMMADKFKGRLVRLQLMFKRLLEYFPPDTFCPKPVHPNRTGHLMIAQEVLRGLCE
jgi:lysophospholipase L1-like esterase